MNAIQPNFDLDGLLRGFFRAEMPDPWPALQTPPSARPARRSASLRGKLALAASVALLVAGSWCLTGGQPIDYSQPPGESPLGGIGDANSRFPLDVLNGKKPKETPKKSTLDPQPPCNCRQ